MSNTESTALAVAPPVPTDDEIQAIRQKGKAIQAYNKEVNKLYRQIEGLTWGSGSSLVRGEDLSPHARHALAEFCRLTKANPLTHIDMMGNKPYLNSNYWTDLINTQEHFHHYEQNDISPSVEEEKRNRARALRARADETASADPAKAAEWRARAYDLEDEADEIAAKRASYSPRATATVVIETVVYRLINAAPIGAIRAGQITDLSPYIVAVPECNWAGGMGSTMAQAKKYDPIGDANPSTTARTRSLRRAAVKSFSAWMAPYEEQLSKAEEIIDAEFEIIREGNRQATAALPSGDGQQAVRTGSGEPEAAAVTPESRELPTTDVTTPVTREAEAEVEGWDESDARKAFMATIKEAGYSGDARKVWCRENGLPDTTKEFTREMYERAQELLVGPTRDKVLALAEQRGANLDEVAQRLGFQVPRRDAFLGRWKALHDALVERAASPSDDDDEEM